MTRAQRRGQRAEFIARLWLRLRLYRIIAIGHRMGRNTQVGEVDIIARRGQTLAFVEVKSRPNLAAAMAAISPHQQRRYVAAARAFLGRNPHLGQCNIRFDAILITPKRWPVHVRDAWRADL